MEVVITIPDGMLETYKFRDVLGIANVEQTLIAHGTVLPKGHGRLIAEPNETDISNTVGGNNDFAECIRDSVKAVFDNAPTIIEAEVENSDGTAN